MLFMSCAAFLILLFNMQTILKIPGFTDNVLTHILAGLGAGFFAVCIGSPIDVVIIFPLYSIKYFSFYFVAI